MVFIGIRKAYEIWTWRQYTSSMVQDRDEVEKYWPSAVLPNAEPPAAVPIGPEFQIGEPS